MRFTKMQGVGNDFVVVEAAALPPDILLSDLAIRACDRQFGIGADGLLVVSRDAPDAAFRMRMFNPDGTEDMCGNGLRCVSLWAYRAGWLEGRTEFTVAAKEGERAVRLLQVAEDGRSAILGVDMGIPRFAPSEIPFGDHSFEQIVDYPLTVNGEMFGVNVVNTGSVHTVIFNTALPDEETFQRVSPLIENHPLFPERTSVLWAAPCGEGAFAVRIWERGAGETLGCGTGACAVGVAAQIGQPAVFASLPAAIKVVSKGGTLQITWLGGDTTIDMVGPAQIVFEGDFAF